MAKKIVRTITRKFGFEVRRYSPNSTKKELVSIMTENECRGNVLLSYIIEPFILTEGEPVSNAHTHDWESLQIAQTFLDLGYCVDVIDYRDNKFIPKRDYSFFVAARTNFQRITQFLNKDCVKIVHLDMAHWLYNNSAAYRRCLDLQQRKGVTLRSYRMCDLNWAIEHADYATMLGNRFTMNTYRYAQKPIYRIPISTCSTYSWPEEKDFESCRKNFLWFGSQGLVHKGLDLVLETFVEMPDYNLTVCGPIHEEKDFEDAYYRELYQTPNIDTVGWVDVKNQEFIEIMNSCIGAVYPSCSEGQSGSVVNCLHGGMIPIISYESGVDVDDSYGVILNDCSIEEIKNSIRSVSSLSYQELENMARNAWEYARANHTRERFAEEYRKVILEIITNHGSKEGMAEDCHLKQDFSNQYKF